MHVHTVMYHLKSTQVMLFREKTYFPKSGATATSIQCHTPLKCTTYPLKIANMHALKTVPWPTWKENHGLSLQVLHLPIDIVVDSKQLLLVVTCTAGYGCVRECPETNNVCINLVSTFVYNFTPARRLVHLCLTYDSIRYPIPWVC